MCCVCVCVCVCPCVQVTDLWCVVCVPVYKWLISDVLCVCVCVCQHYSGVLLIIVSSANCCWQILNDWPDGIDLFGKPK